MNIIINHSFMVPIYEQIVDQIKTLIRKGELKENDSLPSVRTLSKTLKISALTVKKAYDALEAEDTRSSVSLSPPPTEEEDPPENPSALVVNFNPASYA